MTDQLSLLPMLDDADTLCADRATKETKELLKLCKRACDRIAKEIK